ncbi:MAG: efflux RND transporter permease subunit [Planctomycetota bacterium]
MYRSFTLFLIRNSTAVLVLAGVWSIVGLWVVFQTPIDAVPDLSENQILIHTEWPGKSPPEIERRITRPLALAFQGLPGIRTVRGSSDVGYSLLHLIFDDSISFDEARRRANGRLTELHLDLPVTPRLAADGIPTGQIFWYTVEGLDSDLAELRRLQETVVAPQLRSVPGVAEVATVGGFVAEIHVEADAEQLSLAGLTLADLESALVSVTRTTGGNVVTAANSEFLVRSLTSNGDNPDENSNDLLRRINLLEEALLPLPGGLMIPLNKLVHVRMGTAPRRGGFEKDGNEAVAGIVHLRFGHNPLDVTRAVRSRLIQIGDGLPNGARVVPCYDRSPLILSAVDTVTKTLLESLLVTSICIILVMRHWRTSLIIVGTLPLVVLGSFLGMQVLRVAGIADIQTNIMSLAGIVVSIGVLVDSSIVVAENVTHRLRRRFGDSPVTGDISETVADACTIVGRPAFLAIMLMIVSFLPVFALGGIDGKMYRPLAWTKTLALLSAALLTVTLVPVLCARLISGRIRDESESAIVRSVSSVYRPVLTWLMQHPLPLVLLLCLTMIAGAAATGLDLLVRFAVVASVGVSWLMVKASNENSFPLVRSLLARKCLLSVSIIATGLILQSTMRPIGLALRLPLDEGMVMDMPITVPRVSLSQSLDDLKARNMVLCRFPEVRMVTGKAGRAETPFDPAPVDMIETMVEFFPQKFWPSRRILRRDCDRTARIALEELTNARLIESSSAAAGLVSEIVDPGTQRFDAIQREVCWQRLQLFQTELSRDLSVQLVSNFAQRLSRVRALKTPLSPVEIQGVVAKLPAGDVRRLGQHLTVGGVHVLVGEVRKQLYAQGYFGAVASHEIGLQSLTTRTANLLRQSFGLNPVSLDEELLTELQTEFDRQFSLYLVRMNAELRQRSAATWVQVVCTEILARQPIVDDAFVAVWKQVLDARYNTKGPQHHAGTHRGIPSHSVLPAIDPHPVYDALVRRLTEQWTSELWLWPHDSDSINQAGGELDLSVQMPGWANVWTKPIQNRVDMLATGVNSEVGIRVLGQNLDDVVRASDEIAEMLRQVPGAADVLADPIRGKGYITVVPDHRRTIENSIVDADIDAVVTAATGGSVVTMMESGESRFPLRLRLHAGGLEPAEMLRQLPIPRRHQIGAGPANVLETVSLESVADVSTIDGPATIKSENGWLRNYVRLNVRGRDPAEFVVAAQEQVRQRVKLPEGVFVEWTGQYEHAAKTRRAIFWMVPFTVLLIILILHVAFRDVVDAGLMLLSVPGALAGGILCQWMLGFPFSVAVGIGYIACFGMAAATSMVMLVYLREAVDNAGGLRNMSLDDLQSAVLTGAVHRLRPKLLTEATTILSLAPMLWSTGMGADVIRPMAAPVLGGILIADEVVDLLLPIAFYAIRRRRWQRIADETAKSMEKPTC